MGSLFSKVHGGIMKGDPMGDALLQGVLGTNDPLNLTDQKQKEQDAKVAAIEAENTKIRDTQYGVVSPKTQAIGTVSG